MPHRVERSIRVDQVVSKILREVLRDSSPTRSSLPLWRW